MIDLTLFGIGALSPSIITGLACWYDRRLWPSGCGVLITAAVCGLSLPIIHARNNTAGVDPVASGFGEVNDLIVLMATVGVVHLVFFIALVSTAIANKMQNKTEPTQVELN